MCELRAKLTDQTDFPTTATPATATAAAAMARAASTTATATPAVHTSQHLPSTGRSHGTATPAAVPVVQQQQQSGQAVACGMEVEGLAAVAASPAHLSEGSTQVSARMSSMSRLQMSVCSLPIKMHCASVLSSCTCVCVNSECCFLLSEPRCERWPSQHRSIVKQAVWLACCHMMHLQALFIVQASHTETWQQLEQTNTLTCTDSHTPECTGFCLHDISSLLPEWSYPLSYPHMFCGMQDCTCFKVYDHMLHPSKCVHRV